MSALVLQAVLRETEAVAYCHWIQVWAEREQVGIADLSGASDTAVITVNCTVLC